jgi:hypothetical protein
LSDADQAIVREWIEALAVTAPPAVDAAHPARTFASIPEAVDTLLAE